MDLEQDEICASLHFRQITLHFQNCRERPVRIRLHPQACSRSQGARDRTRAGGRAYRPGEAGGEGAAEDKILIANILQTLSEAVDETSAA